MFDLYLGNTDIDMATLVIIAAFVILLPLQIFLCFRVKKLFIRLLPVAVFAIMTVGLILASFFAEGWDVLGYLFLAIYTSYMLAFCGIGWGIWIVVKLFKRKKNNC